MDEWMYSSLLNTATRKTLQCLDLAFQGKDNPERSAAPYKLAPADLAQVRAHAKAIADTVACARLQPVAKAATKADYQTRTAREPYRRRTPTP